MKIKHISDNFMKRENYIFSASFFFLLFFSAAISSCKKKDFTNGKDLLDSKYGINSVLVDTFDIITYSVEEDSIRCTNNSNVLFGIYNDPTFGKFNSSIYTNLVLQNPGTTNFTNSQTVDSVVFSMQYSGYYGTPENIQVEVYELSDLMAVGDTMYQFSTVHHNTENLVESGFETMLPKPASKTIVGTDTLTAHLRIRLKPTFGQHLIDGANQGYYESQDAFKNFFKGLYVKVTDYNPVSGKGAVYYFSLTSINSGLTVYYRDQDNVAKSFKYLINNKGVFFNHVDIDRSGTKVEQLLANASLGEKEFYAQAYGIRAVVEIPGLKNIPSNAIIHSAELQLPFTSYYLDKIYASAAVTIGYYNNNDYNKPVTIKSGNLYNESLKAYIIDINDYANGKIVAQNIINGTINTQKFYIIPNNYSISSERIIFNGKNTTYKLKPKLTVIYTLN
ncbi:MAG: DUF4270 family protein [Flavobacteriia bacterium]|nr:DUF4270 family protein [Flavobacteriia bacterium]OJX36166.1 MAG: hypothetical protein BGO87_06785 [Flavobacteriia bacterium 40-80]